MGARSQRKGASGEREFAQLVSEALGVQAQRYGYMQRRGGHVRPDIDWPESPFWVECKRAVKVNYRAALEQAQAACGERIPVVLGRDDDGEPCVLMRFADWAALASAFSGVQERAVELLAFHWATGLAEVADERGEHHWLPVGWFVGRKEGEKVRLWVRIRG